MCCLPCLRDVGVPYVDWQWVGSRSLMDRQWIVNGLAMDWQWINNGSTMEPQWIGNGPAMDWQWIINGLAVDQQWISNGPSMDWQRISNVLPASHGAPPAAWLPIKAVFQGPLQLLFFCFVL